MMTAAENIMVVTATKYIAAVTVTEHMVMMMRRSYRSSMTIFAQRPEKYRHVKMQHFTTSSKRVKAKVM